jgi:DNA-binding GntR family transcriptional regulator
MSSEFAPNSAEPVKQGWREPPPVLSDAVYRDLLDHILAGTYKPGQVLRQEELAARYSVSRVPLREAMSRLAADGVLVFRPRRGYAVKTLRTEEIDELFQLRTVIEEHAGRLAAQHRTATHLARVGSILDQMKALDLSNADGVRRWLDLNRQFHAQLFASSGQAHVGRIAAMLRDTVEPYIRIEVMLTGDLAQANAEHQKIFNAFHRGDADGCARLCRVHCEHTAQRLLDGLNKRGRAASGGDSQALHQTPIRRRR